MRSRPTRRLGHLPAEPWGRRLLRAREDVAGLTMIEATQFAAHFMPTTQSTISRLEGLAEMPDGPRNQHRRRLATVLAVLYGIDPAEFGLTFDDLPPAFAMLASRRPDEWPTYDTLSECYPGLEVAA